MDNITKEFLYYSVENYANKLNQYMEEHSPKEFEEVSRKYLTTAMKIISEHCLLMDSCEVCPLFAEEISKGFTRCKLYRYKVYSWYSMTKEIINADTNRIK